MMVSNKRYIFSISVLFFSTSLCSIAQDTYSPSSIYGIGEINMSENGYNSGMGSVSTGLRLPGFININNPASLSALDSTRFIYDFAFSCKYSKYMYASNSEYVYNGNFNKILMGFHLTPRWGTCIGIMPYSTVGYRIKASQAIEGTQENDEIVYTGSGGLNKIIVGNAYKLNSNVSVGLNSSFIFGNIISEESSDSWDVQKSAFTNAVTFDFGVQYENKITKKLSYVVGAIYGYREKLTFDNELEVSVENSTIDSKSLKDNVQYLPMFYGAGASVCYNRFRAAFDYHYQKWSDLTSSSGIVFSDVNKFKFGIELVPGDGIKQYYFEKMHYQAGIIVYNSYLTRKDVKPINFGITYGLSLPIKDFGMVNIALELGKSGTTQNKLVRENYTKIYLSMSLHSKWFEKRRYY
jgi:hypothetical protein